MNGARHAAGFKSSLDRVESAGDTRCYDALLEAAVTLREFEAKHDKRAAGGARAGAVGLPGMRMRKRIICLTDGE